MLSPVSRWRQGPASITSPSLSFPINRKEARRGQEADGHLATEHSGVAPVARYGRRTSEFPVGTMTLEVLSTLATLLPPVDGGSAANAAVVRKTCMLRKKSSAEELSELVLGCR